MRRFRARLDKLEATLAAGPDDMAETIKADLRRDLETLPLLFTAPATSAEGDHQECDRTD